jgi:uncharacterized membrane protein
METASGLATGTGAGTGPSGGGTPAVAGRRPGSVGWSGSDQGAGLARALGVFSVGLGTAQLVAPGALARIVGLRPTTRTKTVIRLAGLREIGHGAGILANPRPKEWVGTRIGGDLLDLGLLGVALAASERKDRTLLAAAGVLGVAALDVLAFETLSESRKAPDPETHAGTGNLVRSSIAIGRPVDEVYGFWRDFENLPRFMKHLESVRDLGDGRSRWRATGPGGMRAEWEAELVEERAPELLEWESLPDSDVYNAGIVRFRAGRTPDETIVTVELRYAPPGGTIGKALLRLLRREPGQQLRDDLRRLKQVLETGSVVLSDATAVPGPRPAQPPARGERPAVTAGTMGGER